MEQQQKLETLGRLTGDVAHDVNNLLAVIGSAAQLIQGALPPGDPLQVDVLRIRAAVRTGSRLMTQILQFLAPGDPGDSLADLNESVDEMTMMLSHLMGRAVGIVSQLHPGQALVRAQRGQLDQVVVNLLLNARDAMPQGGVVAVSTRAAGEGNGFILTVTDRGVGMDAATLQRIFEPFFTAKPGGGGRGFGLATVQRIVHDVGGRIDVRSTTGEGTTFEVFFPAPAA